MEVLLKITVGMACTLIAIVIISGISYWVYKKREKTANHPIVIGLSLIALVISVCTAIYLFFGEFTSTKCCFSYSDTSVTVLSILVTILLGWNIWATLDLKNEVNTAKAQIEKSKASLRKKEEELNGKISQLYQKQEAFQKYGYAITDFCQVYTKLEPEKKDYFKTYCKSLNALRNFLKTDENLQWYAQACIDNMKESLRLAIEKGEKCDNKTNKDIEDYIDEVRKSSLEGFNEYWKQIVELENKRKS